MNELVSQLIGKKASELGPGFKINCFSTVISYFSNSINNGNTSAQDMLNWLKENTTQTHKIDAETIIVVWSSSDSQLSPESIEISKLNQEHPNYPFGLVMEHAAVFLNPVQIFQKASPKDEDRFEIIECSKMLRESYSSLPWIRVTYHKQINSNRTWTV